MFVVKKRCFFGKVFKNAIAMHRHFCPKVSLWLSVLIIIILAVNSSSVLAEENLNVTIGQDKIFTASNVHNKETQVTKGSPSIIEAISDGQTASTHILAEKYQSGVAKSWNGVNFEVKASKDGKVAQEAVVSITFDYSLSVNFQVPPPSQEGGGSAAANVYGILLGDEPIAVKRINFIHYSNSDAGEGTKTLNKSLTLEAGKSYQVLANIDSFGDVYNGGYADSQASVLVKEVNISFIKPLKVKIVGPNATVIYNPIFRSPTISLEAITDSPGGSYKWEIINGRDKIRLLGGTNGKTVLAKGIAPSTNWNDITIKLTYTLGSQTAEDNHYMIVQKPTSLKVLDGYPQTDVTRNNADQVVNYTTIYAFQVMDQLNPANQVNAKMLSWETRKLIYKAPPDYDTGPIYPTFTITSSLGAFKDELHPSRYKPTVPPNLLIKVQQRNWIEGWPVGYRCQIYYYDHAISKEGFCE